MKARTKRMDLLAYVAVFLIAAVMVLLAICIALINRLQSSEEEKYESEILSDLTKYNTELLQSNVKLSCEIERLSNRIEEISKERDELKLKVDVGELLRSAAREKYSYVSTIENGDNEAENADIIISEISYNRLPQGLATNLFYCEPDKFGAGSEQKKLQESCSVELGTGLKIYTDRNSVQYYVAAMGGAYGGTIGNAWRVTLKNGTTFNVIMGDFKHADQNIAPDPMDFGDQYDDNGNQIYNYMGDATICVLEFIVDFDVMPKYIVDAGGVHILGKFGGLYTDGGNIVKIEYLGRKWEP